MSLTIMRRIPFCAGHRLLNHGGKCEHFHGHNYVAEVYVSGDEVDPVGRVVDFADINRVFKHWIDEHWDHGFILWDQDRNGLDAIAMVQPSRVFELPYNPTAENMARYLLEVVAPQLLKGVSDRGVHVSKVILWETENSCAEASIDHASMTAFNASRETNEHLDL
jgi:6-pyruvoyltetrahydropterin/6-carboxytetrahydropterin synthase